jgi:hypothetical protein
MGPVIQGGWVGLEKQGGWVGLEKQGGWVGLEKQGGLHHLLSYALSAWVVCVLRWGDSGPAPFPSSLVPPHLPLTGADE